jgi:hypothetical protein
VAPPLAAAPAPAPAVVPPVAPVPVVAPVPLAPQQAAALQLPPPPPGYAYVTVPTVTNEQRGATLTELQNVELRLTSLKAERRRHRIGGPIAMMATGFATSFVFTLVALSAFSVAQQIERNDFDWYNANRYDYNNDGDIDRQDESSARAVARAFGGLAGLSAALGIAGTVFLVKRNARRNEHLDEILHLQDRQQQLLRSLRYGANVAPGRIGLGLSGRF